MNQEVRRLFAKVAELYPCDENLRDELQRFTVWWHSYTAKRSRPQELILSKSSLAIDKYVNTSQDLEKLLKTLLNPPVGTFLQPVTVVQIHEMITAMMNTSSMVEEANRIDPYVLADRDKACRLYMEDDVLFVETKYQNPKPPEWLIARLGTAITKRRQYLLYIETQNGPMKSAAMHTPGPGFDKDISEHEEPFETGYGFREYDLRIPTLAISSGFGGRLQCSCCLKILKFDSERSWRKHFLTDLRPYICTSRNCGLLCFADWESWYAHEMEAHRREWACPCCEKIAIFYSSSEFIAHLDEEHSTYLIDERMRELARTTSGAREEISLEECPLCKPVRNERGAHCSSHDFMEHLSDHLEELAVDAYDRYWKSIFGRRPHPVAPASGLMPSLTNSIKTLSTGTPSSYGSSNASWGSSMSIRKKHFELTQLAASREPTFRSGRKLYSPW